MTEPRPHKHFQIHLSTAMVMMFVAGGIIWANVTHNGGDFYSYGWPAIVADSNELKRNEIYYIFLIVDLVIAFCILAVTFLFCEWLIRRRAAQKGA